MSDADKAEGVGMITIPQRTIAAVDLADEALAALRTIHAAMGEPAEIDDDGILNFASVLYDALRKLQLVREMVNEQHGAA
jgi:hypothetical protein